MMHDLSIDQVQRTLAQRLLFWGGLSIALGTMLNRMRSPFWRGFGFQFIIWGTIDALIALIAGKSKPAQQVKDGILQLDQENRKKRNLASILWVNTVLDIIYVIIGLRINQSKGASNPLWRGQGSGIAIQGGFLFLFDLVHALWLSNRDL